MEQEEKKEEESYTDQDIIEEFKEIYPKYKTRKRSYVDRRNYLICILYYKFNYSEQMIADCFSGTKFQIDRSSINHAKKQPIDLTNVKDKLFQTNIAFLYNKFPFAIPNNPKVEQSERSHLVYLDLKTSGRISHYAHINDLNTNQALRRLITVALNFVEKTKVEVEWE